MTVSQLISKLSNCNPNSIVLTDHKGTLTNYIDFDTLAEVVKVYQGVAYEIVDESPAGQWIGSEPFQHDNYDEPIGVPSVYIGNGTSIKEPLWQKIN